MKVKELKKALEYYDSDSNVVIYDQIMDCIYELSDIFLDEEGIILKMGQIL